MKRINIYIGEDQHRELVRLVQRGGRSGYSEFIRIAIDRYLRTAMSARRPKDKKGQS